MSHRQFPDPRKLIFCLFVFARIPIVNVEKQIAKFAQHGASLFHLVEVGSIVVFSWYNLKVLTHWPRSVKFHWCYHARPFGQIPLISPCWDKVVFPTSMFMPIERTYGLDAIDPHWWEQTRSPPDAPKLHPLHPAPIPGCVAYKYFTLPLYLIFSPLLPSHANFCFSRGQPNLVFPTNHFSIFATTGPHAHVSISNFN